MNSGAPQQQQLQLEPLATSSSASDAHALAVLMVEPDASKAGPPQRLNSNGARQPEPAQQEPALQEEPEQPAAPEQEPSMARAPADEGPPTSTSGGRLPPQPPSDKDPCHSCWDKVEPWVVLPVTRNQWVFFLAMWAAIIGLLVWAFVWAFPRLVDSAYDPTVASVQRALTPVQIGVIVSVACMVLPWTIVIPPDPFVWAAATIFGFGEAFAMVMAGCIPAMAVPFLAVRYKLGGPMLRFLQRYQKTNAILLSVRKAGPFVTVLIIRLGPVPYGLANYLLGLPEALDFWRYMGASIIGIIPSVVVSIIFGRNIKGLSDMLQGESVPAGQLAVNLVSLISGIVLLLGGWWYAKRVLDEMEKEAAEEQRRRRNASSGVPAAGEAGAAPAAGASADEGQQTGDAAASADHVVIAVPLVAPALDQDQDLSPQPGRARSVELQSSSGWHVEQGVAPRAVSLQLGTGTDAGHHGNGNGTPQQERLPTVVQP